MKVETAYMETSNGVNPDLGQICDGLIYRARGGISFAMFCYNGSCRLECYRHILRKEQSDLPQSRELALG